MKPSDEKLVPAEIAIAFKTKRIEFIQSYRVKIEKLLEQRLGAPAGTTVEAKDYITELELEMSLCLNAVEMLSNELFEMTSMMAAAQQTLSHIETSLRGVQFHNELARTINGDALIGKNSAETLSPGDIYDHYWTKVKTGGG